MLLAFDIGNTNIVIGVFQNNKLAADWRIASDRKKTHDEYGLLVEQLFQCSGLKREDVKDIIISSVVPNLTDVIKRTCEQYFKRTPLVVGQGLKTGMPIRYDNPKEVGADRIVNAVAAIEEYGAPLIILDFGTATTFCVINEKGEYLGGAIAPGVGISLNALVERTAQLPKVEMVVPDKVIGKTTVHAIQSGLLYGYCGMVDGMVRRIAAELALPLDQVKVIATGGLAEVIHANTETIQIIDQMLTLKGLLLLYNRNEKLHSGSEGGRKEAGEA